MADQFDLFLGHLGNGTIACNKAVYEHGDYKKIAHISEHGVIEWYVSKDSVPEDAIHNIQNVAAWSKEKFMKEWGKKSILEKYRYMADIPCIGFGGAMNPFSTVFDDNSVLPFEERVRLMEEKFFKTHM